MDVSVCLLRDDAIYDGSLLYRLPELDPADHLVAIARLPELSITVARAGHDLSFDDARLIGIAICFIDHTATCLNRGRLSVVAVSSDPGDVLLKATAQWAILAPVHFMVVICQSHSGEQPSL